MNLIEAIQSGRPFRCKASAHNGHWIEPGSRDLAYGERNQVSNWNMGNGGPLNAWHIVHGDWEIQEPEVKITASQFWKAVCEVFGLQFTDIRLGRSITYTGSNAPPIHEIKRLAVALGLEGDK